MRKKNHPVPEGLFEAKQHTCGPRDLGEKAGGGSQYKEQLSKGQAAERGSSAREALGSRRCSRRTAGAAGRESGSSLPGCMTVHGLLRASGLPFIRWESGHTLIMLLGAFRTMNLPEPGNSQATS